MWSGCFHDISSRGRVGQVRLRRSCHNRSIKHPLQYKPSRLEHRSPAAAWPPLWHPTTDAPINSRSATVDAISFEEKMTSSPTPPPTLSLNHRLSIWYRQTSSPASSSSCIGSGLQWVPMSTPPSSCRTLAGRPPLAMLLSESIHTTITLPTPVTLAIMALFACGHRSHDIDHDHQWPQWEWRQHHPLHLLLRVSVFINTTEQQEVHRDIERETEFASPLRALSLCKQCVL